MAVPKRSVANETATNGKQYLHCGIFPIHAAAAEKIDRERQAGFLLAIIAPKSRDGDAHIYHISHTRCCTLEYKRNEGIYAINSM